MALGQGLRARMNLASRVLRGRRGADRVGLPRPALGATVRLEGLDLAGGRGSRVARLGPGGRLPVCLGA